jgi:uncharacterized membrane protein YphA (DoxX/SURF4 family)
MVSSITRIASVALVGMLATAVLAVESDWGQVAKALGNALSR